MKEEIHQTIEWKVTPGESRVFNDTVVPIPLNHEGIIFEERILPSGTRAIISNKGGLDYYSNILAESVDDSAKQSQNKPVNESTDEGELQGC